MIFRYRRQPVIVCGDSPGQWTAMRAAARKHIEDEFDARIQAGKLARIYKSLLDRKEVVMFDTASIVRASARKLRATLLRGRKFHCPICAKNYRRFMPAGVVPRPNAVCPGCGSFERHRLLSLALRSLWDNGTLSASGRMLHVAPEPALVNLFRRNFAYLSIDRNGNQAEMAMDITALAFVDESFDAIICNHVLEHVPEDRKAMSELYRVMKIGGWGSIQVPMVGDVTQEDLAITDPEERRRRYGQEDHVRLYSGDYLDRLRASGFDVLVIKKEDLLDPPGLERLSVTCEDEVVLARRTG